MFIILLSSLIILSKIFTLVNKYCFSEIKRSFFSTNSGILFFSDIEIVPEELLEDNKTINLSI